LSKTKKKKTDPKPTGKRKRAPRKSALKTKSTRAGDTVVAAAQTISAPLDVANATIPSLLPVLPVRGSVMFPGTIVPLGVGRPASRKMLDESLPKSKIIALFSQKDEEVENPTADDLHPVGTAAMVLKLIRQPDDNISLIVHGIGRITLDEVTQVKPYFKARVSTPTEKPGSGKKFDAEVSQLRDQAHDLIDLSPSAPEQALTVMMNIDEPGALADFLGANLALDIEQKQDLLEEFNVAKRIRMVHVHLSSQLEILRLQEKIQEDVQSSIGETQRRFFLREQIKAIQKELGEDEAGADHTITQLGKRLEEADPPKKVMEEATRELDRLKVIPPASPEYSVITTYLELIADLPWNMASEDNLNLDRARKTLDRDHYDLDKVKRRLIEYLAVRKLNPDGRGPILCLVGPPGVGKTSLGQSIADSLGREFARISLGGIRDESEVRGHRRTYIGAMPGRIIQEMRRAGTNNPVMMLDEIDKLGSDFRGDPSSALLEVLDPRQNNAFVDRYLDVPFDLSQVIFIATANYIGDVPPALRDRMEIIDIPGYTDPDKLIIARRYLVPRQIKENGLTRANCKWLSGGIKKVIENYTREAGVRELERQIGSVCRGVAAQVAGANNGRKRRKAATVDADFVRDMLGSEKFIRDLDTRTLTPGVALGMAYTPFGGEVLFIEATQYPGKGNVKLTGQIGDVMKESASAALSLFKSRADDLGYDVTKLAELDLHIHIPAGAVPKDGPSAGTAMYTAIASLLLDIPVKKNLAMTGEVTLRGKVLPIGGVKEKTLAAARAGVKTILLPARNKADMEEVDAQVKKKCTFHFVDNVDDVLKHALGKINKRKK
jgi:ATP-dependent Lon protease